MIPDIIFGKIILINALNLLHPSIKAASTKYLTLIVFKLFLSPLYTYGSTIIQYAPTNKKNLFDNKPGIPEYNDKIPTAKITPCIA